MTKNINKIKHKIVIIGAVLLIGFSIFIKAGSTTDSSSLEDIKNLSISAKLIQNGKYTEATEIINKIDNIDFNYLKNQQYGDIAFINGNYELALSLYSIAQIHSKDKIMYEYMNKKMEYIKTMKIKN